MAEWKIGNYNIGPQLNSKTLSSVSATITIPYINDFGNQDGLLGSVKIYQNESYIDPNVHGNSITEWGHNFVIANISSVGTRGSSKLSPKVKVNTLPEYANTTWQIAECVRINSAGGTASFPIDEKYFDGGGLKVGANSIIGTNDLGFDTANPALSSTSDIVYKTKFDTLNSKESQTGRSMSIANISMVAEVIDYKTEEYKTRNYIRNTGSAGGGSSATTEFWIG